MTILTLYREINYKGRSLIIHLARNFKRDQNFHLETKFIQEDTLEQFICEEAFHKTSRSNPYKTVCDFISGNGHNYFITDYERFETV